MCTYGNVSDDGLGGHAGAFVLVLAEADTALDPHGAGTDLGKHAHVSLTIQRSHATLITALWRNYTYSIIISHI